MKIFEKYAYYQFRKKIATQERQAKMPKEGKISRVGVLWQPEQKEAYNYLYDHFGKAKTIFRNLCISDQTVSSQLNSNSVTKKDLNWLGFPQSAAVDNFIPIEFDVLLNIALEQNLVLDYITAFSRAKFKIGWSESEKNYFDLNINIGDKQDALYLAKQQIFYLGQLNKTKTDE